MGLFPVPGNVDAPGHPDAVVLFDMVQEALQRPHPPGAPRMRQCMPMLSMAGRSSPSAYSTSKLSRR